MKPEPCAAEKEHFFIFLCILILSPYLPYQTNSAFGYPTLSSAAAAISSNGMVVFTKSFGRDTDPWMPGLGPPLVQI